MSDEGALNQQISVNAWNAITSRADRGFISRLNSKNEQLIDTEKIARKEGEIVILLSWHDAVIFFGSHSHRRDIQDSCQTQNALIYAAKGNKGLQEAIILYSSDYLWNSSPSAKAREIITNKMLGMWSTVRGLFKSGENQIHALLLQNCGLNHVSPSRRLSYNEMHTMIGEKFRDLPSDFRRATKIVGAGAQFDALIVDASEYAERSSVAAIKLKNPALFKL